MDELIKLLSDENRAATVLAGLAIVVLVISLLRGASTRRSLRAARAGILALEVNASSLRRKLAIVASERDECTAIRAERDGLKRELNSLSDRLHDSRERARNAGTYMADVVIRLGGKVPHPFNLSAATACIYAQVHKLRANQRDVEELRASVAGSVAREEKYIREIDELESMLDMIHDMTEGL